MEAPVDWIVRTPAQSRVRTVGRVFLLGAAAVALVLLGSAIRSVRLKWSPHQSSPRLAIANADSLRNRFTIYRDEYGVPHIVGDTEEATFFGDGYAQAQDHLTRMMIEYRDAQGRRAEVEGYSALGYGRLKFDHHDFRWGGDYLQRLLRTKRAVVENRRDMQSYSILDAFARGVNAYIREHRAGIPPWIDGITAEDVEALERSRYLRFYTLNDALAKLQPESILQKYFGSNQWAIAPRKSANGRIIHVEHIHMPWDNAYQLYEAHLITPGRLNAAGIGWFGSPFFLAGFNDRITWSVTWNQPNTSDVYEERLNPAGSQEYFYEGSWRPIHAERENFCVKLPWGFATLSLPLYYTRHGPIVRFARFKNRAWSVKLPNSEGVNYSTGLYALMKASGLSEFKAALSRQLILRWNLLYSDADNIYWVHNGKVAQRPPGFDWRKPVPGWTRQTEWGPSLPFEVYPQLLNPPSGWLQNCNDPPWVVTRDSGMKPLDPAPYYLLPAQPRPDAGEEVLSVRGERIFQVLGQAKTFTPEEMIDLGFDTYVLPADIIVPLLDRGSERRPDPDLTRVIESIRAWDRRSGNESVAFTYLYFWGKAYQQLFPAEFPRFLTYARRHIDVRSAQEQDMAVQALRAAVEHLRERYGKVAVPWGDLNVASRGGIFPVGGAGFYEMLHPDLGEEQKDGRIYCRDGWGHLMVVMEGAPKQIWSLLPYGESEDPSSPHYNDQAKLHSRNRLKPFWFTPTEILEHTESVFGDPDQLKTIAGAERM
jgi:acyl-homoserine-lactone acylase